jgi:hypothetical protein
MGSALTGRGTTWNVLDADRQPESAAWQCAAPTTLSKCCWYTSMHVEVMLTPRSFHAPCCGTLDDVAKKI